MAGRRNTDKEQYWRQRLHAWQDSGLSVNEFCVLMQMSDPSFYAWKRNLQPTPALGHHHAGHHRRHARACRPLR